MRTIGNGLRYRQLADGSAFRFLGLTCFFLRLEFANTFALLRILLTKRRGAEMNKLTRTLCLSVVVLISLLQSGEMATYAFQLRACDPHNASCTYNFINCYFSTYQHCSTGCGDPHGFGCCRHESGPCVNNPFVTGHTEQCGGACD